MFSLKESEVVGVWTSVSDTKKRQSFGKRGPSVRIGVRDSRGLAFAGGRECGVHRLSGLARESLALWRGPFPLLVGAFASYAQQGARANDHVRHASC